jgi:hypothetical protein
MKNPGVDEIPLRAYFPPFHYLPALLRSEVTVPGYAAGYAPGYAFAVTLPTMRAPNFIFPGPLSSENHD